MNKERTTKDQLMIEQLKAECELKTKWLSLIAHDCKGLFYNVIYLLEVLENKSISQDMFVSMLPELKQIAQKNTKTLESTFAWVNAQTNGFIIDVECIPIHSLFLELVEEHEKGINAKELSMIFVGEEKMSLYTDKFLLRFIMMQLVENAIKYSNKGGVVEIIVHSDLNSVNITVKDNGAGMKDNVINSIGTLDGAPYTGTMQEKGAGLSLVIVKDFVELLKGQMYVSSVHNKGTLVQLEFPQSVNN